MIVFRRKQYISYLGNKGVPYMKLGDELLKLTQEQQFTLLLQEIKCRGSLTNMKLLSDDTTVTSESLND